MSVDIHLAASVNFWDTLSGLCPISCLCSFKILTKFHSSVSRVGPCVVVGVPSSARCLLSWFCLIRRVVTTTPIRTSTIKAIKIIFLFTD